MASAPMGFNHFAPQFMGPPSVQMTPRQPEENVDPQEVDRRKKAHQEMLALHHDLLQSHTSLQKQHADLMKAHKELLQAFKNASFNAGGGAAGAAAAAKNPWCRAIGLRLSSCTRGLRSSSKLRV